MPDAAQELRAAEQDLQRYRRQLRVVAEFITEPATGQSGIDARRVFAERLAFPTPPNSTPLEGTNDRG